MPMALMRMTVINSVDQTSLSVLTVDASVYLSAAMDYMNAQREKMKEIAQNSVLTMNSSAIMDNVLIKQNDAMVTLIATIEVMKMVAVILSLLVLHQTFLALTDIVYPWPKSVMGYLTVLMVMMKETVLLAMGPALV